MEDLTYLIKETMEIAKRYWDDVKPDDYSSNLENFVINESYIIEPGKRLIIGIPGTDIDDIKDGYFLAEYDGERLYVDNWSTPMKGEVYFIGRERNHLKYIKADKGRLTERIGKHEIFSPTVSRIQFIARKLEDGTLILIDIGRNKAPVYKKKKR